MTAKIELKDSYTREETLENRKIWVEALRSGEYKQGRGALVRVYDGEKHFCCLGVLSDICGLEQEIVTDSNHAIFKWDNKTYIYMPPVEIMSAVGMVDCDVKMTDASGNEVHETLSFLNDEFRLPFDELASLIEKQTTSENDDS